MKLFGHDPKDPNDPRNDPRHPDYHEWNLDWSAWVVLILFAIMIIGGACCNGLQ